MGATLRGRYQIDIRFRDHVATLRQPLDRPVNGGDITFKMRGERGFGNDGEINSGIGEIVSNAILVIPLGFLFFLFVVKRYP